MTNEIKQSAFQKWFTTFDAEKDAPFEHWTLIDANGVSHIINTDVVKEAIMTCSTEEQAGIKHILVQIDFKNGAVNHFYKHLAQGLIEKWAQQ